MQIPELPWLFPYVEDLTAKRYPEESGRAAYRPLVEVSFRGRFEMEQKVPALVDSGSEHTLLAPWLARALGIEFSDAKRTMDLRVGGETVEVSYFDLSIRLHPPGGSLDSYMEWESEVGFVSHFRVSAWSAVLGQIGFFDRFTVSMHRAALVTAIEEYEAFDARFGVAIREAEGRRPPGLP
ncbi:MAG TPA: retropepsin-like aspartic protease [Actinomycetota bacterium]